MQNGFQSGLDRIVAVVHAENAASSRVSLRLGMTNEGMTMRYYDAEYELFSALRALA